MAPKQSGVVVFLSVAGLIFGLLGLLLSFLPVVGMFGVILSVPALLVCLLATGLAYAKGTGKGLPVGSLAVCMVAIGISAFQWWALQSVEAAARHKLEESYERTTGVPLDSGAKGSTIAPNPATPVASATPTPAPTPLPEPVQAEYIRGREAHWRKTERVILIPLERTAWPLLSAHPEHLYSMRDFATDTLLDAMDLGVSIAKDHISYSRGSQHDPSVMVPISAMSGFEEYFPLLQQMDAYALEAERPKITGLIRAYRDRLFAEANEVQQLPLRVRALVVFAEDAYDLQARSIIYDLRFPHPDSRVAMVGDTAVYNSGGAFLCRIRCNLTLEQARAFFENGKGEQGRRVRYGIATLVGRVNDRLEFARLDRAAEIEFRGASGFKITQEDFAKSRSEKIAAPAYNEPTQLWPITPSVFFGAEAPQVAEESATVPAK